MKVEILLNSGTYPWTNRFNCKRSVQLRVWRIREPDRSLVSENDSTLKPFFHFRADIDLKLSYPSRYSIQCCRFAKISAICHISPPRLTDYVTEEFSVDVT